MLQKYVFRRTFSNGRNETIRVLSSFEAPLQGLTEDFHLTPELCIMSWDSLISLYPFPTFRQHKMHCLYTPDPDMTTLTDLLKILHENGWPLEDLIEVEGSDQESYPFLTEPGVSLRVHRSLKSGVRYVGDKYAYRIRLDTGIIATSANCMPSSVLDHCEFSFGGYEDNGHESGFTCTSFGHPLLKWHYTAALPHGEWELDGDQNGLPKGSIFAQILSRLHKLMLYEVAKLPDARGSSPPWQVREHERVRPRKIHVLVG